MREPETTTRAADPDLTFVAFLADSYPRFLRLARLLTADRGRAEDLTQETFWRVHRAWADLRDRAAAPAFTRTVMVRLATRWRARRWTGEQSSSPEELEALGGSRGVVDPSAEGAAADDVRALDRALAALPASQRAVLVLRYFDGRTEAEIAALLGCSPGTVKSCCFRGLAALRESGLLVEVDGDAAAPARGVAGRAIPARPRPDAPAQPGGHHG